MVKSTFHIGRVTAVPMEPRAALGDYDTATGRSTLYCGGGGAVKQKGEMAAILNLPPEKVRVLEYDIGGNFGSRNRPYVEYGLVVWAAGKIKRPVKFTATRSECFLTDYQGRDLITNVEVAFDEGGKILAMRADNISNVGAHCVSLSPLSKGSGLITGGYDIPAATLRSRAVFTNTMPTNAYRSSGRPEVTFAIERLMDKAADQLGIDRIKLRRKNLVKPKQMPYRNAVGMLYDSGTYEANMDLAMKHRRLDRLQAAQARGEEARQAARPRHGELRRVLDRRAEGAHRDHRDAEQRGRRGDRHAAERPGPRDELRPGGRRPDRRAARLHQHHHRRHRHRQRRRRLAFRALDAPRRHGDQQGGAGADREGPEGRGARCSTCRRTRSSSTTAASRRRPATAPSISSSSPRRPRASTCRKQELAVALTNEMHEPVFPNGCAICEIEIDPDTGLPTITRYSCVDDVGRCINPLIVHGQTHGGIAQGVGQAMWEQCYVEPSSGQPLTGSFMDYGMPRSDKLPSFKAEIVEVLSPTNPLGIKAGGEGGTTPALAVIVSGIVDALRDCGITDVTMPATPYTIWQAIQDAKAGQKH